MGDEEQDQHTYQIIAGQTEDGESVTAMDAPGEEVHRWHEGTAPEGSRVVGDQDGNMVVWNSETGEVTTAMHVTDPEHPDDSQYQVSETDLEF
jgi:hypothetical protein